MIRTLLAQINCTVGDLQGNFKIIKNIWETNREKCDLIVFPELALTGYPPNDLFLRKGFVEEQLEYLEGLREISRGSKCHMVIGVALPNPGKGKPLFNSAVVFCDGQKVLEYHKQLLPTYNVFDENRYFEEGDCDQDNFFVLETNDGVYNVGILICEDCWNDEPSLYITNPVMNLCGQNTIDVVVTINASPSDIGKNELRYEMYKRLSAKYNIAFIYVNTVGGQDALIFDGYSFVADAGRIDAYADGFTETSLFVKIYPTDEGATALNFPKHDINSAILKHLTLGLRDYAKKNGFKTVVVGSSGGIDSAVTLMVAKEALGENNVYAITMPSKYSSEGSVDDSQVLCSNLGIRLFTRPIGNEVEASIKSFEEAFEEPPSRLTIENMQARIRGRILMEFSNHTGALVLSTGNKSEMSVGYCTIYGDMCGGLSVIGDLYKMEVYDLARYYNEEMSEELIPVTIIEKEPSAELWEGQKDSDSLPPYPILDALLKIYLERDLLARSEIKDCMSKISGLALNDINKILKMVDKAEFKRRQAPPVLRIHKRSFGFGRNLPIAQRYEPTYLNVI